MLSTVLGRQMVEPTHSLQRGGFLQCCGAGRRGNSNVLTFLRTDWSQKRYFTSVLFWNLIFVPQLPAQLLAQD